MQITANIIYFAIFIASASCSVSQAVNTNANDPDEPCVSGTCTWSGGDNINSLYSTLSINGSQELIKDITPAAGWIIQGCDPNWSSGTHAFQIVCSRDTNRTQYCDRLFAGDVENTIVRLPDSCGTGPFARAISVNQSSGGHMMEMDYNLSQIPVSRGRISFSLSLGDGFPSSGTGVTKKRDTESLNSNPIPFSFSKSGSLFSQSLSCSLGQSSASLGLEVDGSADLSGTVVFGGSISGSIVPPEVDNFALTTTLTGSGSVDVELDASLKAGTSTGEIPFTSVDIPGLSIPGFVDIGPSLDVDTKVDLDVQLQAKASINTQFSLNSVQLTLPSSAGSSSADVSFTSSDPIHLSVNPSVFANALVVGHVIPKLSLSLSLFDDFLSASAFLESDLSASVSVNFQTFNKRDRDHARSFMKRQNAACIAVDAAAGISAGVSGSIGPLKDGDDFTLFSQTDQLYQNCLNIGGSTSKREEFRILRRQDDSVQCPSPSEIASDLESLI